MSGMNTLRVGKAAAVVAAALLGAGMGHVFGEAPGAFELPRRLALQENQHLEGSAQLAVANTSWLMGTAEDVKRSSHAALKLLPATEGAWRSRLLLRLALLVESPDGQRALQLQACSALAEVCDNLQGASALEAQARAVAPGNALPPSMVSGHPPITQ